MDLLSILYYLILLFRILITVLCLVIAIKKFYESIKSDSLLSSSFYILGIVNGLLIIYLILR